MARLRDFRLEVGVWGLGDMEPAMGPYGVADLRNVHAWRAVLRTHLGEPEQYPMLQLLH